MCRIVGYIGSSSSYEKVVSNIQEVKARKGRVIAVVTEGDVDIKKVADYVLEIPDANDAFLPLLATIPSAVILSYGSFARLQC